MRVTSKDAHGGPLSCLCAVGLAKQERPKRAPSSLARSRSRRVSASQPIRLLDRHDMDDFSYTSTSSSCQSLTLSYEQGWQRYVECPCGACTLISLVTLNIKISNAHARNVTPRARQNFSHYSTQQKKYGKNIVNHIEMRSSTSIYADAKLQMRFHAQDLIIISL
jgi:hypothetical protein